MGLFLENICNHFLHDISFSVQKGDIVAIIGPTGAGKTSLLKTIVGLLTHTGRIFLDDKDISKQPTYQRQMAMLFQNHVLFPQKNVTANIAFGLQRYHIDTKTQKLRMTEIMQLLDIEHLATRFPHTLSGGEKQRVALAQILILQPKALFLDEPLTHLDIESQEYLSQKIPILVKNANIPAIVVTHNPIEIKRIANYIGSMKGGQLEHMLQA